MDVFPWCIPNAIWINEILYEVDNQTKKTLRLVCRCFMKIVSYIWKTAVKLEHYTHISKFKRTKGKHIQWPFKPYEIIIWKNPSSALLSTNLSGWKACGVKVLTFPSNAEENRSFFEGIDKSNIMKIVPPSVTSLNNFNVSNPAIYREISEHCHEMKSMTIKLPEQLPTEMASTLFFSLSQGLKEVSIARVSSMCSDVMKSFPKTLSNLTLKRYVYQRYGLPSEYVTDTAIIDADCLTNLPPNLRYLKLARFDIWKPRFETSLPNTLRSLSLHQVNMELKHLLYLPTSLTSLSIVEKSTSESIYRDMGRDFVWSLLDRLSNIKEIKLKHIPFNALEQRKLPSTLTKATLSHCGLSPEQYVSILPESLIYLKLDGNFYEQRYVMFPIALFGSLPKTLQTLDIGNYIAQINLHPHLMKGVSIPGSLKRLVVKNPVFEHDLCLLNQFVEQFGSTNLIVEYN